MKNILLCLLLLSLSAFADSKTEVSALIVNLGAADFKTRKAAKLKLISMGSSIRKQLHEELKKSSDPEVVANLKEVLKALQTIQETVSGTWEGEWTSKSSVGYLFKFKMNLKVDDKLQVTGQINWTQLKSPSKRNDGKSAVEHIKGSIDKETGLVHVKGFKKDDPQNVIALDEYKITIDQSGSGFNGKTSSHGTWKGLITGKKVEN